MQPQVIICKDRAEWLEARKDGLGASDAAALLGLSPWKTNVQLWEEKCGLVIPEDIGDKPYVRYGNDAEPLLPAHADGRVDLLVQRRSLQCLGLHERRVLDECRALPRARAPRAG